MMDPNIVAIILGLSCFFSAAISGVLGMAGGVTLLSIFTFFFPFQVVIPLHGVLQLISNGSRLYFLKDHIVKKLFLPYLPGPIIGAILATQLLKNILAPSYPLFMMAALIFYSIFRSKKKTALTISPNSFFIVGIISGILGMLVGATGPFLAAFFIRPDLTKEEIVATKSAMQMITHVVKIPAFIYLGVSFGDHALLLVIGSIATVFGTRYGIYLLDKISKDFFMILLKIVLGLSAIRLVVKGLDLL